MIIDQKGKLFGKISIVDILIVVIIFAAAAGVFYKLNKSGTSSLMSKSSKIELTMYMEDVSEYAVKAVKEGDTVKDRTQNVVLGKVTSVKVGPDVVFYPDSDGVVKSSSKPGYASITITVEGQGTFDEEGATFNGLDYYINKAFETRVGAANFYMRITDIKKLGE